MILRQGQASQQVYIRFLTYIQITNSINTKIYCPQCFFIVKVNALNFKAPLGKKIIKVDIPGGLGKSGNFDKKIKF